MSYQTILLTHRPNDGGIDLRRSDAIPLHSFARGAYAASLRNAVVTFVGVASLFLLSSPASAADSYWVGYQSAFGSGNPFNWGSFFHGDNWSNFHVPTGADAADFNVANRARFNGPPTTIYFGDVNVPPYTASNNTTFIPGGAANIDRLAVTGGEFTFVFDANAPFYVPPPTGLFQSGTLTTRETVVSKDGVNSATLRLDGRHYYWSYYNDFTTGSLTIGEDGHILFEEGVHASVGSELRILSSGTVGIDSLSGVSVGAVADVPERGLSIGSGGALFIAAGGQFSNTSGSLGNAASGSTGTATATVTGAGSKWTNSGDLRVGNSGNGALTIEAGGEVSNTTGYLGIASGTGTVTVTGAGSKWTNSGPLDVGFAGNGTLTIKDGGLVSDSGGTIGYHSGSTGVVTVSGVGSKWTSSGRPASFTIGELGNGTLIIEAGGEVSIDVNSGIFLGRSAGSTGTVKVTGAGSKWTANGLTDIGSYGAGTLLIEAGGQVSTTSGSLGYAAGSTGVATVTGVGSKWSHGSALYVGNFGNGSLTVADGGEVVTSSLYASLSDLHGNGTITAGGAVLDANFTFDAAHGASQSFAFGSGGMLNVTGSSGGHLGAGYKQSGSLTISEGVNVSSGLGYLGFQSGSTGTATVTGPGSKWSASSAFTVGGLGNGSLTIEAGGQVVGGFYGSIGSGPGSSGAAKVTGAGSEWTLGERLYVGDYGNGTLTIEAGGQVSNNIYAHLGYDSGTTGAVTVTGAGSKWTNSGGLNVGSAGNGTLTIEAAGEVSSDQGDISFVSSATGTATVTGAGSKWAVVRNLYVGGSDTAAGGIGKLSVKDHGITSVGSELRVWSLGTVEIDSLSAVSVGAVAGTPIPGALSIGSGGTLSGTGLIDANVVVLPSGTISPGASPGKLTIDGDLLISQLGTLKLEFAGTTAGMFDQLQVAGDLSILGTIQVSLLNGFQPLAGDSFKFFNVGGALDLSRASFVFPAGLQLQNTGNGEFRITAVPEPATIALTSIPFLFVISMVRRRRSLRSVNASTCAPLIAASMLFAILATSDRAGCQ